MRNASSQRPILSSGSATTVEFNADQYVFEGFAATGTGGNGNVLYHHADDITIASPAGHDFPNPLALPRQHPPQAKIDVATLRPANGQIDIGAYKFGVAPKLDPRAYIPFARR